MIQSCRVSFFIVGALICSGATHAQYAGSSANQPSVGSRSGDDAAASGEIRLTPEEVQGYIAIKGQAERRVKPTEIRLVVAVTEEAARPADCYRQLADRIQGVKTSWINAGISPDKIVDDFIAMLP